MGNMSSRRGAARGFGLTAAACAAALALAGQAAAATTAYPAGGSGFDGDAQGWVGSATTCTVPLIGVCEATNAYEATVGNPPGSIATNVDVLVGVGLLGLLSGGGTWTSPSFAIPSGEAITGATFGYDRRLDSGGLISVAPTSAVTVTLVDETAGTSTPVLADEVTESDTFTHASAPVAVVGGHTYHLEFATTTTADLNIGLTGMTQTYFDNVALTVQTGDAGGDPDTGGPFPIGTPGVTVVKRSLTSSEISRLIGRYGINADVGKGPGGSLVPLAECTVVGTPGRDRILGSRGNDVICGLGGNDVVIGGGGRDLIDGANGADRLAGAGGGDLLLGLRGNDRLTGGAGRDGLGGGAGADVLRGGKGRDRLSGRTGRDVLYARDRTRDRVVGGPGRDRARVDRAAATSKRAVKRRADRVRGVERVR